jgi:hypothetical protein
MHSTTRFVILLLGVLMIPPAIADPALAFGPLRVPDLSPYSLAHLDPHETHPDLPGEGEWVLTTHASWANTTIMSPNVAAYLAARPGKSALRGQVLSDILALPGDVYLFDGELALAEWEMLRRLTDHSYGFVRLRALSLNGGILDGAVDQFHQAFGFEPNGRDRLQRNTVSNLLRLDSGAPFLGLGSETEWFQDPVVGLGWRGSWRDTWLWNAELSVKLNTHTRPDFFANDHTDIGASVSLQSTGDKQRWYLAWHGVYQGSSGLFPSRSRSLIHSVTASWAYDVSETQTAILQGTISQGPFEKTAGSELGDEQFWLTAGWRWNTDRSSWELAVTENVINFENTSDIVVHGQWQYRW